MIIMIILNSGDEMVEELENKQRELTEKEDATERRKVEREKKRQQKIQKKDMTVQTQPSMKGKGKWKKSGLLGSLLVFPN